MPRIARLQPGQPHARRVVLDGFGSARGRGVWTPDDVQIHDRDGTLLARRSAPRAQFTRPLKQLRWDALDILYFAGYALWNYLSFPYLLTLPGVRLQDAPSSARGATRQLVATFDPSVPTHSAQQRFHVNDAGHLVRHDYTADVIGTWAHAAHLCLESTTAGGLHWYTRRRVYPLLGANTVLPAPTLVWIELDEVRVTDAACAPPSR